MSFITKAVVALILVSLLSATQTSAASTIVVPRKVASLLVPILDLLTVAMTKHPVDESEGSALWRSSELLGHLFDDQSPAADEALVVLFNYYLGESNGEDLVQSVTTRGPRMLPILQKYRCCAVQISGRAYPNSIRLPDLVKASFFQEAIELIQQGKTVDD
jgi:hypothetical protein